MFFLDAHSDSAGSSDSDKAAPVVGPRADYLDPKGRTRTVAVPHKDIHEDGYVSIKTLRHLVHDQKYSLDKGEKSLPILRIRFTTSGPESGDGWSQTPAGGLLGTGFGGSTTGAALGTGEVASGPGGPIDLHDTDMVPVDGMGEEEVFPAPMHGHSPLGGPHHGHGSDTVRSAIAQRNANKGCRPSAPSTWFHACGCFGRDDEDNHPGRGAKVVKINSHRTPRSLREHLPGGHTERAHNSQNYANGGGLSLPTRDPKKVLHRQDAAAASDFDSFSSVSWSCSSSDSGSDVWKKYEDTAHEAVLVLDPPQLKIVDYKFPEKPQDETWVEYLMNVEAGGEDVTDCWVWQGEYRKIPSFSNGFLMQLIDVNFPHQPVFSKKNLGDKLEGVKVERNKKDEDEDPSLGTPVPTVKIGDMAFAEPPLWGMMKRDMLGFSGRRPDPNKWMEISPMEFQELQKHLRDLRFDIADLYMEPEEETVVVKLPEEGKKSKPAAGSSSSSPAAASSKAGKRASPVTGGGKSPQGRRPEKSASGPETKKSASGPNGGHHQHGGGGGDIENSDDGQPTTDFDDLDPEDNSICHMKYLPNIILSFIRCPTTPPECFSCTAKWRRKDKEPADGFDRIHPVGCLRLAWCASAHDGDHIRQALVGAKLLASGRIPTSHMTMDLIPDWVDFRTEAFKDMAKEIARVCPLEKAIQRLSSMPAHGEEVDASPLSVCLVRMLVHAEEHFNNEVVHQQTAVKNIMIEQQHLTKKMGGRQAEDQAWKVYLGMANTMLERLIAEYDPDLTGKVMRMKKVFGHMEEEISLVARTGPTFTAAKEHEMDAMRKKLAAFVNDGLSCWRRGDSLCAYNRLREAGQIMHQLGGVPGEGKRALYFIFADQETDCEDVFQKARKSKLAAKMRVGSESSSANTSNSEHHEPEEEKRPLHDVDSGPSQGEEALQVHASPRTPRTPKFEEDFDHPSSIKAAFGSGEAQVGRRPSENLMPTATVARSEAAETEFSSEYYAGQGDPDYLYNKKATGGASGGAQLLPNQEEYDADTGAPIGNGGSLGRTAGPDGLGIPITPRVGGQFSDDKEQREGRGGYYTSSSETPEETLQGATDQDRMGKQPKNTNHFSSPNPLSVLAPSPGSTRTGPPTVAASLQVTASEEEA